MEDGYGDHWPPKLSAARLLQRGIDLDIHRGHVCERFRHKEVAQALGDLSKFRRFRSLLRRMARRLAASGWSRMVTGRGGRLSTPCFAYPLRSHSR